MADDLDVQAEYRKHCLAAGVAYGQGNRLEYAEIVKATMVEFTGQPGQFKAMMRLVHLRCAKRSGFPEYPEWLAARYPAPAEALLL